MWSRIADYFGLTATDYPASLSPLEKQMDNDQAVWTQMVAEHGLKESDTAYHASGQAFSTCSTNYARCA